ncbi:MAG: hypothetical protein COT16_00810 [Elusimicrobia bacterium CG08_land_8_20_14_0_20_44_26]|nr:MAG: hypothetical protein COT16_00810 [Elusimicrobia bacterium CG08_land_8_20_14_0_20_44_26]
MVEALLPQPHGTAFIQSAAQDSDRSFYNFIFRPETAWSVFTARRSFVLSLFVFLASSIAQAVAFGAVNGGFFIMLPFIFLQWIIAASAYHFFSYILGGRGDVVSFFCLWAMTDIPLLFLPSARILSRLFLRNGVLISFSFIAAVYAWSAALKIKLLKFNYHISSYNAFFVFLFPIVAAGVIIALSIVLYALWLLI